jgi:DNA-binding transcriptional LysR family regulator
VALHIEQLGSLAAESSALRERTIDLGMFLLVKPHDDKLFAEDLNVEVLFHEQLVAVAGGHSRWMRRRKIDLAELVDEPWVLTESDTMSYIRVAAAFAARGLGVPKRILQRFPRTFVSIWPLPAPISRRCRIPPCASTATVFR